MKRVVPTIACCGVLATLVTGGFPGPAAAQWPPTHTTNVTVLPANISIAALVDTMAGFTRALGIRCSYCHVGGETTPFDSLNFASDSMAAKVKAREMMRMVVALNRDFLAHLDQRRTPPIVVTCATCHRGVAEPRPLQDVLLSAYDGGGVDSLETVYRALRTRYYGRAAYDFGEVSVADVAAAVRRRDKLPDAVRLYQFNVEVSPTSGFALRQAASAEASAGDTATAISSLQRALTLNPNDSQAKALLDAMKKK